MDLLKNPFHILGATPRDDRYRIMELAEECSLLSDADVCTEARAILTNPRRRIAAEVAWLPEVDPTRYDEVLSPLHAPSQNLHNIIGMTPLAEANLLVSKLSRLLSSNRAYTPWILTIAQTSETINPEEVRAILNADRRVAGFPEITDLSVVEDEIRKQRIYYARIVTAALENLSVRARAGVMTSLLERATSNGRCPILIENLIPMYESSVQVSLDQIQNIIEAQDQQLRVMANAQRLHTTLASIMDQLLKSLKEWDTLVQPIQLSKTRTGQRHQGSVDMARRFINLAAVLFLEHRKADFSRKILNTLKEVFAEIPEIAEQIAENSRALEEHIPRMRGIETFEKIKSQVEKLQTASDAREPDYPLRPMVNHLIQTVKTWQPATQPVEANETVALVVRAVALHLWNEHKKLDFAIQITNTLVEVFVSSNSVGAKVARCLTEDKNTLTTIDAQLRLRRIVPERTMYTTQSPKDTGCLLQIVIFAVLGLIGALLQGC